MKRFTMAAIVAVVTSAVAFAFAASLNVSSQELGAGATTVSSCDTDGVTTAFTTTFTSGTGYTVAAVAVSGLNADACAGRTIGVSVTNAANTILGSGTLAVSGSGTNASATVTMGGSALASAVERVHVVIG